MFGFGNKQKAKVKVKTAKGGGPIRKVRFIIGTGVVLSALKWVGADQYIPPELMEQVAKFTVEGLSLAFAIIGWWVRPGVDDGVAVEG